MRISFFIIVLFSINILYCQNTEDLVQAALPSIVLISTTNTVGSGVIINEDGYIITNYHVVSEYISYPSYIQIMSYDNNSIQFIKIVDYDVDLDLAIIKTEPLYKYSALSIAEPGKIKPGSDVICIGCPFGVQNFVTKGIVSKYNTPYIFTSSSINPGNSGGAMINMKGELIGIPTMSIVEAQNFNIAICCKSIRFFLDRNNIEYSN